MTKVSATYFIVVGVTQFSLRRRYRHDCCNRP